MDATLEGLYRLHAADLVGFATVLVGPDDALDVVSEAVLATIERNSLDAVSDGTVRKQLARGREQLRGVFDRG